MPKYRKKPVLLFSVSLECPHCKLSNNYEISVAEHRYDGFVGVEMAGGETSHYNTGRHIIDCSSCREEFLVNLFYQIIFEKTIRKIESIPKDDITATYEEVND